MPTNIGQVTSIRTLEKQIKRLRVSEYEEVRSLGEEIASACAAEPDCRWDENAREPLAPTLARHAEPDEFLARSRTDLKLWAEQNLPPSAGLQVDCVDLVRPTDVAADIAATLLYSVTDRPFRELYDMAAAWPPARCARRLSMPRWDRAPSATISRAPSAADPTRSTSSWTLALTATFTGTGAVINSARLMADISVSSTRRRQVAAAGAAEIYDRALRSAF